MWRAPLAAVFLPGLSHATGTVRWRHNGAMSTPANDSSRTFPTIPRGEVIGRYENYLDAQKVVDYLADNDFPVSNVSIIGNDLKLVERVRAKLTYPRVAGQGALQGAMMGIFFGLLLMLFAPGGDGSLVPLVAAALLGAVLFMLLSVLSYAMQRGKRDFASTRQVLPSTWDVLVDVSVAAQARQLAGQLPMNPGQAGSRPGWGNKQSAPVAAAPGAPVAPAAQPAEPGAPAPTAAFGYGDLDDGRPRYGVRLDQQIAQAPQEQAQDQAPAEPSQAAPAAQLAPAAETTADTDTAAAAPSPATQVMAQSGPAAGQAMTTTPAPPVWQSAPTQAVDQVAPAAQPEQPDQSAPTESPASASEPLAAAPQEPLVAQEPVAQETAVPQTRAAARQAEQAIAAERAVVAEPAPVAEATGTEQPVFTDEPAIAEQADFTERTDSTGQASAEQPIAAQQAQQQWAPIMAPEDPDETLPSQASTATTAGGAHAAPPTEPIAWQDRQGDEK